MKELIWEITNECFNNCRHCSSLLCDSEGTHCFKANVIEAGVKAFNSHGFNHVILSGGEPGLHPELDVIIDSIVSAGSEVSMYTSGVYRQDFFAPIRLRAIKKLRTVFLSLYSSNPQTHDKLTGKAGSFQQTVQALDRFITEGINVEVNIVPMSQNQNDLEKTTDYILSRGARKANVLKLVRQGNADKNWFDIKPNYEKLKKTLDCLKADEYVRVGTPFGQLKSSGQFCGAGFKKICITFDGYILPCEVFKHDRKKFPNILDQCTNLSDVIGSFDKLKSITRTCQVSCFKSLIQEKLSY